MPTFTTDKQLAQRRSPTTAASIIYQVPNQSTIAYVKTIIVCNTTSSAATYSIYVNQGGTATGDDFAIIKSRSIAANASDQLIYPGDAAIILNGPMIYPSAAIMAVSSVGAALTFTLFGSEVVQS